MTQAQQRFVDIVRQYGDYAAYWDVVNDWLIDKGPTASLAFHNHLRTVNALRRSGYITLDEDGCFHLTERAS